MRILVLRGGALGDFIVTLPALRLLREKWPDACIEFAGNARAAELGVSSGYLDTVHSQHEARWSALYSAARAELPAEFSTWLSGFDIVINYWPDPEGELARRFPVRRGQIYLSAPARPSRAPAARHYCEPLRALGLSTTDYRTTLPAGRVVSNAPRRFIDNPAHPIAAHPGSGSPGKNWPEENWLELIRRLDGPVLLVLGESEGVWSALTTTRFERFGDKPLHFARSLPLPELARLLASCRLFLGHDSGVSHLAAAVGTPCVLLFGPTDPALWAPPGDHVRVIREGDNIAAITVENILSALPFRQPGGIPPANRA